MTGRIFLIRHGETAWTLSGQHTGKTDIPLTQRGVQEAKRLGEELRGCSFTNVYCSPLVRAKETCKACGYFAQAEVTPDLYEWDYGRYEGLTTAEIHQSDPDWSVFAKGGPGGESVEQVTERAQRMLERVRGCTGDVALFSSGHFSRALAAVWLGMSAAEGRFFLYSPGALSLLGYEHALPVIQLWNAQHSRGAVKSSWG